MAADYQKRKRELEKQTSPIFLRLSELEARPRVVKHANEARQLSTLSRQYSLL